MVVLNVTKPFVLFILDSDSGDFHYLIFSTVTKFTAIPVSFEGFWYVVVDSEESVNTTIVKKHETARIAFMKGAALPNGEVAS